MVLISKRSQWWLIFLTCLVPLLWLTALVVGNQLGTDPVQRVAHFTGEWALYLLLITLAVTPVRRWLKWNWLQRYRRMLGLYCLFYASVHLLVFVVLILELRLDSLYEEFLERPYISVGAAAYFLLLPLGVTSFKAIMRRMGKQWLYLHRMIYLIALLAWVHLFWQVRSDYGESIVYAVILFVLMVPRAMRWFSITPPPTSQ